VEYYPNGVVKAKTRLKRTMKKAARLRNITKRRTENGGQLFARRKRTLEEGTLKEYDEKGQLVRIANCKSGTCLTQWKKN